MQTQLKVYLDRRGHRMNFAGSEFSPYFKLMGNTGSRLCSNKMVNNLSMHDDSLDAETGHHRLRTATVQDFDPNPQPARF